MDQSTNFWKPALCYYDYESNLKLRHEHSLRKECKGADAFNEETQEIFLVGEKATQRTVKKRDGSVSGYLKPEIFS